MKHTAGNWRAHKQDGEYFIVTDTSKAVALVYNNRNDIETEANAKLIAAAPEMAEVLQKILNEFNDVQMNTPIAYFKSFDKAEELLNSLK